MIKKFFLLIIHLFFYFLILSYGGYLQENGQQLIGNLSITGLICEH